MRRPHPASVALLALAFVFGWPDEARAQPKAEPDPIPFEVDPRAKGCPSARDFHDEVTRHTGEEGSGPLTHAPRVSVRIELVGSALHALIDVDEDTTSPASPTSPGAPADADSVVHRRQVLTAPSYACRDLASAAAITVSLIFRAAESEETAPLEPEGSLVKKTPAEAPLPPPPPTYPRSGLRAAPPRPHAVMPLRHSLSVGAIGGKGAVPDIAIGPVFAYSATWRRRWGLTLDASLLFPRLATGAHHSGVRVGSRTVSLAPCVYDGILFGCVAGSLGAIVGEGENVQSPETRAFLHAEVGLRVGARVPLTGPFALRADVRGELPLTRSRFLIERDTVWQTPSAMLTGTLVLETTF